MWKTPAHLPPAWTEGAIAMISLRTTRTTDEAFLAQLYASTRADEMALMGWDAAQSAAFLRMQHQAQTQSYRMQLPAALWQIVLSDETPIGQLVTDRSEREILLVDIALMPDYRNRGIGAALIQALQAEAAHAGQSVLLHVQVTNPARRLYQRLGFVQEGCDDFYLTLRWRPASHPQ